MVSHFNHADPETSSPPSSNVHDGPLRFEAWLPIVFNTLQIVGGVGVFLLVLTYALSRRVRKHRHPVWLNLCLTWVISSITYVLLAFPGWQHGHEPPFDFCLAQAALIYGAPPLTACSALAVVIQLQINVHSLANPHLLEPRPTLVQRIRSWALLLFPYVVYLTIVFGALAHGLNEPRSVMRRNSPYCFIATGRPGQLSGTLVALLMAVTLTLEAHIAWKFYMNGRQVKSVEGISALGRIRPPISLLVRVFIFTFVGLIAIGCSFLIVMHAQANDFALILPNIVIALMPTAAFMIFGTSRDILRAWTFWRPPPLEAEEDPWSHGRQRLNSTSSLDDMPDLKLPV